MDARVHSIRRLVASVSPTVIGDDLARTLEAPRLPGRSLFPAFAMGSGPAMKRDPAADYLAFNDVVALRNFPSCFPGALLFFCR